MSVSTIRWAWVSGATLAAALPAVSAHAHPDVDEGVARYEQAEFTAALAAFRSAAAGDDLRREDLLTLLATRALVHFALGESAQMTEDLRALASLDPAFEWGPATAPPLVEAFEDARNAQQGVLSVEIGAEIPPGARSVRVHATVLNDGAGLGRETRLRARIAGGAWEEASGGEVTVGWTGAVVEVVAVVVGPGGAELARRGTAESPETLDVPAPPPDPIAARRADPVATSPAGREHARRTDASDPPWPWIVVGAAVAVGLAIAVLVLLRPADQGELAPPVIDW